MVDCILMRLHAVFNNKGNANIIVNLTVFIKRFIFLEDLMNLSYPY